jgi:hypothetical protein
MKKSKKSIGKFSSEFGKMEMNNVTGGDTYTNPRTHYTTGYTAYTSTGMPTTVWDDGLDGQAGAGGNW